MMNLGGYMMNLGIDYSQYMDNDSKVYIDVVERRLQDGQLIPLSFVWEDGTEYEIDRVMDVRRAASLKAGGAGMRYTVRVKRKDTFMFLEEDRGVMKWFMEKRKRA
jgi:hypothetical protein